MNLPVPFQAQLPTRERPSRELARFQRDIEHLTAIVREGQLAIGDIYTGEFSIVIRDLQFMNSQLQEAIRGGMPPGQVEALYGDTIRYQQYMSGLSDAGAARILELLQNA